MSCKLAAQLVVVSKNFGCGVNWIAVLSITWLNVSRYPLFFAIRSLKAGSSAIDLRTGSTWSASTAALRRCSLPVAHCKKSQAALLFVDLAFIPSDHTHRFVASEPPGPLGPGCHAILPAAGAAPGWFWK